MAVEESNIRIIMEGQEYIPLSMSGHLKLNGIKLKETSIGMRVYKIDEFPDPPYGIIYFLPDIDMVCIFPLGSVKLPKWLNAEFLIEGLSWLKEPNNQLRMRAIEESFDGFVLTSGGHRWLGTKVTFVAINPPVKNPERII